MKSDIAAIFVGSIYLLVYCIFSQFESTIDYAIFMWMMSPLLVISMVIWVLKFGKYEGPELGEKEYGYGA